MLVGTVTEITDGGGHITRLIEVIIIRINKGTERCGLFGHLLDYASGHPARAMGNECYSLNWDEVQLVPQPTNTSCWAAAATMIVRKVAVRAAAAIENHMLIISPWAC